MTALPSYQEAPSDQPALDDQDVIHFRLSIRNPITIEKMPLLAKLLRLGFLWKRGLPKRLIGKPSKLLFRWLSAAGYPAQGKLRIETANGPREVTFNARNSQFSSLYFPQYKPFYEADLCTIFDRLLGPRDVFFDIGANWGWHSIVMAVRPSFQGAVHAFEPFPSSFTDLADIVKQAGLESRITCHNLALGEKDGTAGMVFPDGMLSGGAQLSEHGVQVPLARLDTLDLPPPKLLKIDVEGHEMGVLKGAAGLIQKARPYIVFENWMLKDKPETTFAPLTLLLDDGYALFYPGWVKNHPDCILGSYAGTDTLALVPFLQAHRSRLGDLINVVAVPRERMEEFHACFN
jgi:FkbM family methyltransferase